MTVVDRFQGGRQLMLGGAVLGAAGLIATGLGLLFDPRQALFSYLVAFAYFAGIAIAALILLATFNASSAQWPVILRRMLEKMALSCVILLVLFLPIAIGMKHVFAWADPGPGLSEQARHLLEHKRPYLNIPFFLTRSALYFAVWIVVSHLLHGWSTRQDTVKEAQLTVKQRRLGAGSLPVLGLTITFAAFDWLMSLNYGWYSTIFGVYYFAGSLVAAIAMLTLVTVLAKGPNLHGRLVSTDHLHNLGNFLLAFVAFWAYIAFSQYLLIWIADIPEEIPWYQVRTQSSWRELGVVLIIANFVVPFFSLLSRKLKRNPSGLAVAAVWILAFHYLDLYWVAMPALHAPAPRPYWTDLTALIGVGATALAYTVWRMRGSYAVPVGDPFLTHSLRYHQP
jgi:hypothetical protein